MSNIGKISPAFFFLVLICFLMPFVNVNCGGQRVMSMTGVQLITGMNINQGSGFGGNQQPQRTNGEPLAIIVGIIAVVGLITSFYKKPKQAIIPSLLSAAGVAFMFILKVKLDSDVQKSGQGIVQLEYAPGYWLALISFAAAAVINFMVYNSGGDAVADVEDTRSSPPVNDAGPEVKGEAQFCTQCGVKNLPNATFCKSCGSPME